MPSNSSPLQPHHVSNLILILRAANSYYSKLASQVRSSLRPTHHARTRAQKLGLTVNIGKAVRLDPRQVSVVPLPILDVQPSPDPRVLEEKAVSPPSKAASPPRNHPTLRCIIPSSVQSSSKPPASRHSASDAHWQGDSSRWSATPIDGDLLSPLQLTAVDADDDVNDAASVSDDVGADSNTEYLPSKPLMRLRGGRTWHLPDAPVDEATISWNRDIDSSSPSSSRSSSTCSTTSGSESDYSGPTTPEVPLVLHIKRKSVEIPNDEETFEKRPKFERKDWALPVAQRKNNVRIPPVRRLANEQAL